MKCTIFNHDWTEWQDYKTEELKRHTITFSYKSESENIGLMMIQLRRCNKCKRVQLNNIKTN